MAERARLPDKYTSHSLPLAFVFHFFHFFGSGFAVHEVAILIEHDGNRTAIVIRILLHEGVNVLERELIRVLAVVLDESVVVGVVIGDDFNFVI
jgi:hypothetical protein